MRIPFKIHKRTRRWFFYNDETIGVKAGYSYEQFYQKFHYKLYKQVDVEYSQQVIMKDIELEDDEAIILQSIIDKIKERASKQSIYVKRQA
jgi:hypothetical protein